MIARALTLCLLLGACGSGGMNPVVSAGLNRFNPFGNEEAGPPKTVTVSRTQLEAAGQPAIRISLEGEEIVTTLVAATSNNGTLTYLSRLGQSITLRGTQVVATRGIGTDLLSVAAFGSDPVAQPRPLEAWPEGVTRRYEVPGPGVQGRLIVATCLFAQGDQQTLVVLGQQVTGQVVEERCAAPDGSRFDNLHLVEPLTGQIWRSRQWIGPDIAQLDLSVIVPATPLAATLTGR
ncbi:MAG: YjbF family lipoprotein [Pseudomonadota bacterium]